MLFVVHKLFFFYGWVLCIKKTFLSKSYKKFLYSSILHAQHNVFVCILIHLVFFGIWSNYFMRSQTFFFHEKIASCLSIVYWKPSLSPLIWKLYFYCIINVQIYIVWFCILTYSMYLIYVSVPVLIPYFNYCSILATRRILPYSCFSNFLGYFCEFFFPMTVI